MVALQVTSGFSLQRQLPARRSRSVSPSGPQASFRLFSALFESRGWPTSDQLATRLPVYCASPSNRVLDGRRSMSSAHLRPARCNWPRSLSKISDFALTKQERRRSSTCSTESGSPCAPRQRWAGVIIRKRNQPVVSDGRTAKRAASPANRRFSTTRDRPGYIHGARTPILATLRRAWVPAWSA